MELYVSCFSDDLFDIGRAGLSSVNALPNSLCEARQAPRGRLTVYVPVVQCTCHMYAANIHMDRRIDIQTVPDGTHITPVNVLIWARQRLSEYRLSLIVARTWYRVYSV